MAVHFTTCSWAYRPGSLLPSPTPRWRHLMTIRCYARPIRSYARGDSYLDMWKKAVDRDRHAQQFQRAITDGLNKTKPSPGESLVQRTELFNKILEVPRQERDRIQQLQVIDRAAAAIAATRALLKEVSSSETSVASDGLIPPSVQGSFRKRSIQERVFSAHTNASETGIMGVLQRGRREGYPLAYFCLEGMNSFSYKSGTPGPDFWSWSPPADSGNKSSADARDILPARKSNYYQGPSSLLMEKEQPADFLRIPFESNHNPPLPPLQSLMSVKEEVDNKTATYDLSTAVEKNKLDVLFSSYAKEAAEALGKSSGTSSRGADPDGSKWWRETGIEQRPDGIVCKWTLTRGISADQAVEFEDKFWEASDRFDYKELGSEKSGRDAAGNVWRECWKESIWQDQGSGLMHIAKTADKWGKNGMGDEWQENWWEHYDASGQAEKWAHKWCCIDPNTPLDAGHAHVWHERWGETYDGQGGSVKYTDKWAERSEGTAGWSKWGDKWDENFDPNSHGVKQGETWWEGPHGERWNRTWGEHHNGSGWVHKYGKNSSGEHWDTHEPQDTWYERYPHYGFDLCFKNSVQLRAVRKQMPKTS